MTVRLDPKIIDGLNDIGDRIGIAPASLAALAIGEYVAKTQTSLISAGEAQSQLMKELANVIAGPMASILMDKTPEELKELFNHD